MMTQYEQLNQETAITAWAVLQRFFAAGQTIAVDKSLDLVEVALHIHQDDKVQVEKWMKADLVGYVSNEQAKRWISHDAELWTVVVKPWVLVQELKGTS